MTESKRPNPQDEEATPVTPAPVEASPSSTGVVTGDDDEPRPPQL